MRLLNTLNSSESLENTQHLQFIRQECDENEWLINLDKNSYRLKPVNSPWRECIREICDPKQFLKDETFQPNYDYNLYALL